MADTWVRFIPAGFRVGHNGHDRVWHVHTPDGRHGVFPRGTKFSEVLAWIRREAERLGVENLQAVTGAA